MTRVQNIVREARSRLKKNQAEFARLLGKTQGLVSKYERGAVNPPAAVLDRCLDILQVNNAEDVNVEALAKRVRTELKAPRLAYARKTIAALLDGLQSHEVV